MDQATLIRIGGKLWEAGDKRRVYFNNLYELAGLELSRYGTGNISSATLRGEHISNTKAGKLATELDFAKIYFDLVSGQFYGQGVSSDTFNAIVTEIRRRAEQTA